MLIRTVLVAAAIVCSGVAQARQVKSVGKIKTANEAPIDPVAARKAIESADQDFIVALKKKDVKAIGEVFEPEAVYFPSGADAVHGRDQIMKYLSNALADRTIDEASLVTQEVTVAAHTAYETGAYTRTVRIGGAPPVSDHGKYLVVWQYGDDKKWRILRDIANTSVPTPQH
jgi:ketosteroid isomerase-like protein